MKYCIKCKTKNSDDSKHCKDCGEKLLSEEEDKKALVEHKTTSKQERKKGLKLWIWILVIGILGTIVLGAATIKFPYTGMVTVSEKVPINKIEKYPDTELYPDKDCNQVYIKFNTDWGNIENPCLQQECAEHYQVCIEKNFWGNCIKYEDRCSSYKCVKNRVDCRLNIKNIDDEGGSFRFKGYVVNLDNNEQTFVQDVTVYVRAQDIGVAYWSYIYNYPSRYSCTWQDMITPTKTVCENVVKQRTVTKERTVVGEEERQVQKEVVKYRTLFETWGWV